MFVFIKDYSWIQEKLEGLYDLEWKISTAFGTYTFQMNASGNAGSNFKGNTNPQINLNIKPTFPEPKPVKVGYMAYDDYHSKIDCKNLIKPTRELYCKDKKR